ncbi:hypothetical protein SAMD00019534_083460, partial [Acytostelium subglobosum LB1]|uniref:hypothetical protein n=1 Tax=Acytostelium subglobosum LB1 TaxID=1410327 RepID=UPI000644DB68
HFKKTKKDRMTTTTTTTTPTPTPTPTTTLNTATSINNSSACSSTSYDEIGRKNLIWRLESFYGRTIKSLYSPALAELVSIGVCPRCCLRYFNIREIGLYQEPVPFLSHLINYIVMRDRHDTQQLQQQQATDEGMLSHSITHSSHVDRNSLTTLNDLVCVSCLGMLQNTNSANEFLDTFLDSIGKCNYEFIDYSLALWMPQSTIIREYSIWFHLHSLFGRDNDKDKKDAKIVDIKEAVKWILGPLIVKRFNFKFQPSSDFRMNMTYSHEETKDEHLFLFDIKTQNKKKRRTNNRRVCL